MEAATLRLCRQYRVTRLRFDRMQAEQLTANLARAGIATDEFVFSSAGASRLARSLYGALRDRALSLPDDEETRAEFVATRLIETGPGTVKLQNPPGAHDDIVTAVGMVVADLTDRPEPGYGSVRVPTGAMPARDTHATGQRPTLPAHLALRRAARTRGQHAGRALLIPGSANDPSRQRGGRLGDERDSPGPPADDLGPERDLATHALPTHPGAVHPHIVGWGGPGRPRTGRPRAR